MRTLHHLRIYVLEDEIITQELIKQTLAKHNYELVGMADNATDALTEITQLKPNLVLLDVNVLGEKSGVWLAERLENCELIFLTAFSDLETIQSATKLNPTGYLLKPYNEMQLIAAIQLAEGKINRTEEYNADASKSIVVKDGHSSIRVRLQEIQYVKADTNYIHIHKINGERIITRMALSKFHEKCPEKSFLKVHRSYVVNFDQIDKISADFLHIGGIEIPVSRLVKEELLELFNTVK